MAYIKSVRGFTPQFGENCFLAENATVVGDVIMGDGCSVWFNAVVRGDVHFIKIGNKVNIQLSVEGDPEDKLISPLIFVNFIENSFKHGSKPGQDKNAFIDLKISITDLMIHFLTYTTVQAIIFIK